MSYRKKPFAFDEWYHCYSRSIDTNDIFKSKIDHERFLEALYLCNSDKSIPRSYIRKPSFDELLSLERGAPIVGIGAYCLMPNHFHLLLKETSEGGISKFMQRLGTSFSMYFNTKYQRVGNVFVKPFRSKHIHNDQYLSQIVQYIHLNPAELFEARWKEGVLKDEHGLEEKLRGYHYSSLPDYVGQERIETRILTQNEKNFLSPTLPRLTSVIEEAALYFRENNV